MLSNYIKNQDFLALRSNFLSLSVLQFINMILPLLTLPYLVRVLGVETFGLVSFVLSIIMYFNVLVSFGFELSATQQISISRDNLKEVGNIFSNVLAAKLLLLFLSAIILIFLVFSIDTLGENAGLCFATFGIVIGNFLMPTWMFQGMENMKYITFANVISKGIFTVLIFIFIKDSSDYIYVPVLTTVGAIIAGIYSIRLVFLLFNIPLITPNKTAVLYQIKTSYHFFLSRLANTGGRYYAITIIGVCFGNVIVGYYAMVEKLFYAFTSLGGVISQTIYPYMSRTKNIKFLKRLLIIVTFFSVLFIVPIIYYNEILLSLIFNLHSPILSKIFIIVFSGAVFSIVSAIIGFPLLAALGYIKYANNSLIYSSILYICYLSFFAITNQDIYIMSFGIPLYMIIGLIFRFYYIQKTKIFIKN